MKTMIITISLLLLFTTPAQACIGARAHGMGNAYVSVADDPTAAYWCPAALVDVGDGFSVSVGHSSNIPFRYNSLALSANNLGVYYINHKGNKDIMGISYGIKLDQNISCGLGIAFQKPARQDMQYVPLLSTKYSSDSSNPISIAILIQGYNFRPSISWHINDKLLLGFEEYDLLDKYNKNEHRLGAEFKQHNISFRSGYITNDRFISYSVGLGIKTNNSSIDLSCRRMMGKFSGFDQNYYTVDWTVAF